METRLSSIETALEEDPSCAQHGDFFASFDKILDAKFEHYLNATPAVKRLATSLQVCEDRIFGLGQCA